MSTIQAAQLASTPTMNPVATPISDLLQKEPKLMRLYKCHIKGSRYVFKNGKCAHFINGKYITDVPSEIVELDTEIAGKIPHIYIDENEREVDVSLTSEEKLKRQYFQEFQAEQAKLAIAQRAHNTDRGTSTQGPVGAQNSLDVAGALGGSISMNAVAASTPTPTVKASK